MNSRERVSAAMARKPVDRVPLGFYAVDHDTIEHVIGRPTMIRNKVETQIAIWEGRRDELAESYKKDSVEFYRKIDCADLILFKEAPLLPPADYEPDPPKKIGDDLWEDRHGCVWQADRQANDIMCVNKPAAESKTYSVEDFPVPEQVQPPSPSIFEAFDHLLRELGEERYISGPMHAAPMPMLGSFEDAMVLYATQPEVIHAVNRRNVAIHRRLDAYYCRPGMAGAHVGQDMAGTNGPFISPAMWREMCFPYLKQRIRDIKQHTDQVNFHGCGRTIDLMDMIADAGVDCYQSLQTTAGMEIGSLKERFGDRMAFWGGVALEVLIMGTPEEVRKEVRTAMERGAPGGGFILGPSHSVAKNTRYENFMAMLDEFVKLRDKY